MVLNTDFMIRYNLAKFILQYVDYFDCVDANSRKRNGRVRQLGDFLEKRFREHVCSSKLSPKNFPVSENILNPLHKSGETHDECLYMSAGLEEILRRFYQGRGRNKKLLKKNEKCKASKSKSGEAPRRDHYISKLPGEFFKMMNDEYFRETVRQIEGITQVLGVMWHPTRPVESVGQYAIAKHASIHYILSTHAILPSAECFTPGDIQRIMHLPMEWIGALPRQEDTRCITKFIARFAELFARKPAKDSDEPEDPLDRHARHCGQRVFLDIIRYACDGTIPPKNKPRARRSLSSGVKSPSVYQMGEDEYEKYPPLDWADQLTRRNVKIITIPRSRPPTKVVEHGFRRPVKNKHIKQEHILFVSVDESTIMKESNQIIATLEVVHPGEPQNLVRFAKTRALKRGALQVICPTMHDLRKREPETLETRILREENSFEDLVLNLPHRAYGIHQLEKIQTSVLAGIKPPPVDTSWLKDPTTISPTEKWSATWDPNRRIHLENAVRNDRLPNISITHGPTLQARKAKGQRPSARSTRTSERKGNRLSGTQTRSHPSHRNGRRYDRRRPSSSRHSQISGGKRASKSSARNPPASGRQNNNFNTQVKLPFLNTNMNGSFVSIRQQTDDKLFPDHYDRDFPTRPRWT
ncbi:hypothetical protein FGIG_01064 [Fasciola gigantica]|uniref:Uncharacterized protein n=1 Tax=Fasciola gigantica TaxID=46835 RepID=A0A504Y3X9_FASGI|nr:hypothetical protein FGIG_01064 [Fasciola gigantica]